MNITITHVSVYFSTTTPYLASMPYLDQNKIYINILSNLIQWCMTAIIIVNDNHIVFQYSNTV